MPLNGGQLAIVVAKVTNTDHCGQNTAYVMPYKFCYVAARTPWLLPAFSFALKPRCWHRITVANHSELFLLKRRVVLGVCFALSVETS